MAPHERCRSGGNWVDFRIWRNWLRTRGSGGRSQTAMTIVGVRGRAERLLNVLGERDLDQMMVSDRSNIRWLSGFTGSAGVLIISARACAW
jgi:hypothetical protein